MKPIESTDDLSETIIVYLVCNNTHTDIYVWDMNKLYSITYVSKL